MAKVIKKRLAVIVAVLSLASCGAANQFSSGSSSKADAPAETSALNDYGIHQADEITAEAVEADSSRPVEPPSDTVVTAGKPQLIKRAQLSLLVDSVDAGLKNASHIIRTQQGDILDLQDNQIEAVQRTVYLRIRVPQANLDRLLAALSELGTIQQQGLNAEDVSTQIVDAKARLRNLRKTEESVLKIMERSGEISQVLEVSRELSRIRAEIEQIDARLQNLQNQVRYSTIDLTLAAAVPPQTIGRPITETLGSTWRNATQSVGDLTVGLMQIGLWLLAFSPFLLILAIAGVLGYRTLRRRPSA